MRAIVNPYHGRGVNRQECMSNEELVEYESEFMMHIHDRCCEGVSFQTTIVIVGKGEWIRLGGICYLKQQGFGQKTVPMCLGRVVVA